MAQALTLTLSQRERGSEGAAFSGRAIKLSDPLRDKDSMKQRYRRIVVKLGTTAPPWIRATRPKGARPEETVTAGVAREDLEEVPVNGAAATAAANNSVRRAHPPPPPLRPPRR